MSPLWHRQHQREGTCSLLNIQKFSESLLILFGYNGSILGQGLQENGYVNGELDALRRWFVHENSSNIRELDSIHYNEQPFPRVSI